MKKILWAVLTIALIGTLVNDISRYAKANYDLGTIATDTAYLATRDSDLKRDQNAMLAAQYADTLGATLYQFDQTESGIRLWVQMPVEGTWLLRPIMSIASDQGIDAPYYIQLEEAASFR